jgi:hypothetical protein
MPAITITAANAIAIRWRKRFSPNLGEAAVEAVVKVTTLWSR